MQRIVPDTSVLIDWLNRGRHQELLLRPGTLKYLSGIVAMELGAGADRPRDRRILARLVRGYRSAGRVLAPTAAVCEEAGNVLRLLRRAGHDSTISNDVLIALSARSIGAAVVTADGDDFRAIRRLRAFALVVV